METTIHKILRAITERVVAIVGSAIGTAASSYRAVYEAEQQCLLEDIAAQYDADGKHALAENLRKRAAEIQTADSSKEAENVFLRLCDGSNVREEPNQKLMDKRPPSRKNRNQDRRQAPAKNADLGDLE